jgi:oligopeptide/dipeptide ABC transporter ATP-binding protein
MSGVIEVRGVTKRFKGRDGTTVTAVNNFSCSVAAGETVGLIGESGSGKSTLGRLMLGLIAPDGGEITFEGIPLASRSKAELSRMRARMQVVFQEPYASLNPRLRVKSIIAEPLVVQGVAPEERAQRVAEVMDRVELPRTLADRFPIQLSGGQQQRVGIARAVVGQPRFVVLDEPTASLDRTIRRNITDLLMELQRDLGLAYLLITHDIASVRRMATRSLVMFRGHLVESGPTGDVLAKPGHPYTRALVSAELIAKPGARKERYRLNPRPPGARPQTPGCPLTRVCPLVIDACSAGVPPLLDMDPGHQAACIRWRDVATPPVASGQPAPASDRPLAHSDTTGSRR